MKLYDNDAYREEFMALVYDLLQNDGTNDRANQIIDAFDCVPEVDAEPLPSNDPLTLEELRHLYTIDPYDCCMKPVWIEIKKDMPYSLGSRCSGYDLIGIDESHPDFAISICDRFLHMKCYGEDWIAYRRKPEDDSKGKGDTPK